MDGSHNCFHEMFNFRRPRRNRLQEICEFLVHEFSAPVHRVWARPPEAVVVGIVVGPSARKGTRDIVIAFQAAGEHPQRKFGFNCVRATLSGVLKTG